jgi:hypothetical protein
MKTTLKFYLTTKNYTIMWCFSYFHKVFKRLLLKTGNVSASRADIGHRANSPDGVGVVIGAGSATL